MFSLRQIALPFDLEGKKDAYSNKQPHALNPAQNFNNGLSNAWIHFTGDKVN